MNIFKQPLKPLDIAAWVISILFHPLNMALAGCIVIAALTPYISAGQLYAFSTTLLFMLFVLPLLFALLYWIYAKIVRQEFSEKQQRLALLFSTSVVYFFTSYNLIAHNSYSLICAYILACGLLTALGFCITIFWKISLHAIGVGGFLALILQLSLHAHFFAYLLIPLAVTIAGLVLSARLYLQAHTPLQVVVGFAIGLGVVFFLCR